MNESLSRALEFLAGAGNAEMHRIGTVSFFFVLLLAGASALLVAAFHRWFYASRDTGSEVYRVFPLLGISVTAIFVCIQFSLPLSLGLLGALSIVRFRTPVKEPEEIGFILVVIAASLACATLNLAFLAVFLASCFLVLLAAREARPLFGGGAQAGMVLLTLDGESYEAQGPALFSLLGRELRRGRLESIGRHEGEVVVTWSFSGLDGEHARSLEQKLREAVTTRDLSIVFSAAPAL